MTYCARYTTVSKGEVSGSCKGIMIFKTCTPEDLIAKDEIAEQESQVEVNVEDVRCEGLSLSLQ